MKTENFLSQDVGVTGYMILGDYNGSLVKPISKQTRTPLEIGQQIITMRKTAQEYIDAADKLSELLDDAVLGINVGGAND